MLGASTTSWSNRFHQLLITRFEKKVSSNIPRAPSFYQFQVMTSSALLIIIYREQFLGTYTTYPLDHLKHLNQVLSVPPFFECP